MKNAILKFSLTALATLTLAACGSSGGDDAGSRSQAPTKDKPATQANQPTKKQNNSNTPVLPSSNNKTGGVIVVDNEGDNVVTKTLLLLRQIYIKLMSMERIFLLVLVLVLAQ